jgi:hypothetical protein
MNAEFTSILIGLGSGLVGGLIPVMGSQLMDRNRFLEMRRGQFMRSLLVPSLK